MYENIPIIVVFGTRLEENGMMGDCLLQRCKSAAFLHNYWQEPGRRSFIVVVGATYNSKAIEHATVAAMTEWLLEDSAHFVDPNYIKLLDGPCKTTAEYARAVLALIRSSRELRQSNSLLVVTSAYHMPHVEKNFRQELGDQISVMAIPTWDHSDLEQ